MQMFLKELHEFISEHTLKGDPGKSQWFKNDYLSLYLRVLRNSWLTDFKCDGCLVIANVGVTAEHRRRGIFTSVLHFLEKNNPYQLFGIESVSSEANELMECLKKEGFTKIPHNHLGKHFYKLNLTSREQNQERL